MKSLQNENSNQINKRHLMNSNQFSKQIKTNFNKENINQNADGKPILKTHLKILKRLLINFDNEKGKRGIQFLMILCTNNINQINIKELKDFQIYLNKILHTNFEDVTEDELDKFYEREVIEIRNLIESHGSELETLRKGYFFTKFTCILHFILSFKC